jgi:hypothetical protein
MAGWGWLGDDQFEQDRPADQGVAALGYARFDRDVQPAGGADGQADTGGQVADLDYQQPRAAVAGDQAAAIGGAVSTAVHRRRRRGAVWTRLGERHARGLVQFK